ncbi:MAG: helix-turn-helix transcriptional regulator [Planctomycetes bacterium]|nr:helix-turn-helix transcriptional regulator [Planctomycetota bacterium]
MRIRTAKDLGLLAREQRKRRGWGQAELAERVGVSRQWVVAFEGGKPGVELGLVLRTLHELGLELEIGGGEQSGGAPALESAVDLDALLERARRTDP